MTIEIFEDFDEVETDGRDIWVKCKTRQSRGLAHVDYLAWSVRAGSMDTLVTSSLAHRLAHRLQSMLGGEIRECRGANFYEHSLRIFDGKTLLAIVLFGGEHQRATVHCQIPGAGWLSRDESLNAEVHRLLEDFGVEHLSRIDIARDCFAGEASFDGMTQAYEAGAFKPSRGITPSTWAVIDTRRGSTRYVGRRENGRCIRGYEKSMQLARQGGWFRVELELRSVNRRVPIDAVLRPAEFFAGACKFCADLADTARTEKVVTRQKTVQLALHHVAHYARVGYGPLLKFLRDQGLTGDEIVSRLTVGVTEYPRRLAVCTKNEIFHVFGVAPPNEFA